MLRGLYKTKEGHDARVVDVYDKKAVGWVYSDQRAVPMSWNCDGEAEWPPFGHFDLRLGPDTKRARYRVEPVSQDTVEVTDTKTEEFFFLRECDDSFRIYNRMVQEDPNSATIWFEGFLKALDYCDRLFKGEHVFRIYE